MERSVWKRLFLHCTTVPRLENIAAVNVAIQLWKEYLREGIRRNGYGFVDECRNKGFARVFDEVEKGALGDAISLPKQLKAKVAYLIRPIGLEILKWMNHSCDFRFFSLFTDPNSVDYISWTMQGTIDVQKTLKLYLTDIKDLQKAYYEACWHCLEDSIYTLWGLLPEMVQNTFSSDSFEHRSYGVFAMYWTCCIKSELHRFFDLFAPNDDYHILKRNRSIHESMLILAIYRDNLAAVKYFWVKFTKQEKRKHLMEWLEIALASRDRSTCFHYMETSKSTDVFCFLLLRLRKEKLQKTVFNKYAGVILKAFFINWPWQLVFLPTIELMWDFLDGRVYATFLSKVVPELKECKSAENLFKELWLISPIKFKKHFIQYVANPQNCTHLLLDLCRIADHDCLTQILMHASIKEKRRIAFCAIASDRLFQLFYADKMSCLPVLVENVLPEREIASLKNKLIMEYGVKLCEVWICDNNWQSVEKLLNWCFISDYEIDKFKKEEIDHYEVFSSLACIGNYELVDKFINWCFSSAYEIRHFRKEYLCCKSYNYRCANEIIVKLSCCAEGWKLFENFISYCFSSEDAVNQFKELLTEDVMQATVHDIIADGYNFEFSSKFVSWRYASEKEISEFKRELSLSFRGKDIYDMLAIKDGYNRNHKLVTKLNEWYSPC